MNVNNELYNCFYSAVGTCSTIYSNLTSVCFPRMTWIAWPS